MQASTLNSRAGRRFAAKNAERLRSRVLGLPQRPVRALAKCNAQQLSKQLATEFAQKLPAAALAGLVASLSTITPAFAADYAPAPETNTLTAERTQTPSSLTFQGSSQNAPAVRDENALPEGNQWRYSEFVSAVESGKVERVRFSKDGTMLQLTAIDGRRATVVLPNDPELVDILARNGVDISVSEGDQQGNYVALLGNILFPLIAFGGLFFLFRRAQGGQGGGGPMGPMGGPMEFGRSKSKFQEVPETGVTFADVAGCDGAKLELQEVVDFLKNPDKYTALGAKIPKGCLLVGPPGTGKTLLAKAVAGEAGTPFFSCAASEFVELFVGVGASRVRDLFEKAKSKAPCIIFIDEIDAVGRQRGAGLGGGNDEREQTINQLLTEMDGFEGNTGIIVIAATNRADILDPALLRPGRFDRQVTVDVPDQKGRLEILKVHSRNKKLDPEVDLQEIALRTPGFAGADLANLLNEAAILAGRKSLAGVRLQEIDEAVDRIVAGMEGKPLTDGKAKSLVAYHEVGHAVCGTLTPGHDAVQKVTLIPRGQARGLTWFIPGEDPTLISKQQIFARIVGALGGRAAEEIIFGDAEVTSGASGDLQQVTNMARQMVINYGMSDIGPWSLLDPSAQSGDVVMRMMARNSMSENLQQRIDEAVKQIATEAYEVALKHISENREAIDRIVEDLLEKETLTGDEFRTLLSQYTTIPEENIQAVQEQQQAKEALTV